MATIPPVTIRNAGARRIVIGRPAKAKGEALVRFDTPADSDVPAAKRLGQVHKLEGERGQQFVKSRVFLGLKDRLGLQVA